MPMPDIVPGVLLCIASYEKGQAFLAAAAAEGARVVLLTAHKLRQGNWPHDSIFALHTMGDDATSEEILRQVRRLARDLHIARVVALDEFDLEAAALVREDLRLPGMGQTTTRHFRDKLAMRVAAQTAGVAVPEFVSALNRDDLRAFAASVPGPWLLKPRFSASAIGIRTVPTEEELWRNLEELGDAAADFLLERFVSGDIFHVDSITWNRNVRVQSVHQYGTPPMSLMQQGGVFTTRTVASDSDAAAELQRLDAMLVPTLGMVSGVTHSEWIRSDVDGRFYFLETAARVGGAHIAELIEFSTGLNPWVEWARIECALLFGRGYAVQSTIEAYAGSVLCLARQAHPDLSGYTDPEIVWELETLHHAGLIVQANSAERVRNLTEAYALRFAQDFCAVLPPPDKPTS